MNTIKANKVEKEIKKIKTILSAFPNMNDEVDSVMKALGYEYEELGTGQSAYICSGIVAVRDIKSKNFLNGKYLVVGCSNRRYGKGNIYRGYVKEIIEIKK
jgi:hypothetical protein